MLRAQGILDLAIEMSAGRCSAVAIGKSVVMKLKTVNKKLGMVVLDEATEGFMDSCYHVDKVRQTNKLLPTLAGIPISIKDNFNMQNSKTTAGSRKLSLLKRCIIWLLNFN